jgi:LuxR family transcriptional regulator, maltose regulon positive regulatory protein
MPSDLTTTQVVRKVLCNRICAADAARLVLVQAPPGCGKTTAMLQFRAALEAQGVASAWLTLDRADNRLRRFVQRLGREVHNLTGYEQIEELSEDALNSLRRSTPFAIFLDNFEVIDEMTIFTLLRTLIEQFPRGGRFVIATRSAPKLPLARLRGLGILLELDVDDLRFNLDETEQYFRLRCPPGLSRDSLGRLHDKTEGWITGLWLASMSIERQGPDGDFVERFSGSTRAVADYLTEEILAYQPEEVREFLLRTSILRQLNASLCRAILPGYDVERILRRLEEQNLLLLSAPGEHTYRYHSLFADYLHTRLGVEQPGVVAELHLAAARWYEAEARAVPAIDHAIESGQYSYALSMMTHNAQALLEGGRMRLLSRWFSAIPAPDLRAHPLLEAISIWATIFTRGPWLAAQQLQSSACALSKDPRVAAHVSAQRLLILVMQDRYDEAGAIGPKSLECLPTCDGFADSILCNTMAALFFCQGEHRKAQRLIDDARRLRADSTFIQMCAETIDGMLDLQRGKLQAANAKFRTAVQEIRTSYDHDRRNELPGILSAAVQYEMNNLHGAEHLLNIHLPAACDVVLRDHMIIGHTIIARIAFERRETTRAFETLTALERLGTLRRVPRLIASARLERSRLFLLQDDAQASMEELERAAEPTAWDRLERQILPAHEIEYLKLAQIRWDIHFGDVRATLPRLADEIEIASRQSRHLRVMKLRVLQSLALQRSGDSSAAMETLNGILRQASREGFLRLLVDEGEGVGRLVARFYSTLEEMPAKRSDPVLVRYVQQLIKAFGVIAPAQISIRDEQMESLTQKELQVLQLVGDGNSNGAISQKLAISSSTVRTHLRSVHSKLNARSRTEAVAIGRRLDLIR